MTSFEEKFSKPPYLNASYRVGRFYGVCPVPIAPRLIEEMGKRVGNLLPPGDAAELKKNFEAEKALDERMGKLGFFASTTLLQQAQAAAQQKIKAGESVIIPSREQVIAQISSERAAVHQIFREIAASNFRILKTACQRFETVAREYVVDRDAQERAAHLADHGEGIAFTPTSFLRGLCYVALAVSEAPIRNFELCGSLRAPDPARPLIDLWIQSVPVVQKTTPAPAPAPVGEAGVDQQAKAQAEAAAASRRAEVEEKNAFVQKIKDDIARNAAETELANVKKLMDADARRDSLKATIQAEKKPTP